MNNYWLDESLLPEEQKVFIEVYPKSELLIETGHSQS
jgi:hypothetical protein